MAVLKLIPAGKDYLWGGTKLMTDFGKKYDGEKPGGDMGIILSSRRPEPH